MKSCSAGTLQTDNVTDEETNENVVVEHLRVGQLLIGVTHRKI